MEADDYVSPQVSFLIQDDPFQLNPYILDPSKVQKPDSFDLNAFNDTFTPSTDSEALAVVIF